MIFLSDIFFFDVVKGLKELIGLVGVLRIIVWCFCKWCFGYFLDGCIFEKYYKGGGLELVGLYIFERMLL